MKSINPKTNISRYLLFAYLIVVTVIMLADLSNQPDVETYNDKILHLLCFLVLIIIAYPLCHSSKQLLICIILAVCYGILIEIIQPLFGREGELMDVLFNCIGIICGTVISYLLDPRGIALKKS